MSEFSKKFSNVCYAHSDSVVSQNSKFFELILEALIPFSRLVKKSGEKCFCES